MSTPTQENLKQQAKVIRKFLSEKYEVDVSHGHCMELISQLLGYKDWNTASAALKPKDSKDKQSLLPIHIKTVGDMKKALALFDDDSAIFDGQYEFKIKKFVDEVSLEEWDEDTVITQEFRLVLKRFVADIASFELELEDESMTWFA